MIGVALAYVPAVWLLVAVTVLAIGWLPRLAALPAWLALGYCVVIALFADSFDLPGWTQRASPFSHTPRVPLAALTATPLLVLAVCAAALTALGYAGLRRRDLSF